MSTPALARRGQQELWVGAFVLAGVAAVLILLYALTDPSLFRGRYVVSLLVDDAQGIRNGDAVRMRGVQIGRVRGFVMRPEGVTVRLELDRDFEVAEDSQVILRTINVLGEMAAEVHPGTSERPLRDGAVIRGQRGPELIGSVSGVASEARQTLDRVQALLSPETVEDVEASSHQLRQLIESLRALSAELRGLTRSARASTERLELLSTSDELPETLATLDEVARSLDVASGSAAVLLVRLQRGEGTLGRLLRDDTLYVESTTAAQRVAAAATAVERLAEDIRKRPERYLSITIF